MKTNWFLLTTFALCLNVFGADPSKPALTSDMSDRDLDFAKEAAMGGMLEVKLGELAVKQAESSKIKEFGRMMVSDHGKANDKLKTIASNKKLELPTALDDKHQKEFDKLAKLQRAEFDKEYVSLMVKDHEKTLDLFKKEADSGKDADLKAFASEGTGMIQHHLDDIKAIKAEMK